MKTGRRGEVYCVRAWNLKTGKGSADPAAMPKQIKEGSDFRNLPPLTILCLRTLLVITKHLEDGPGIAQMDNTTTRVITF